MLSPRLVSQCHTKPQRSVFKPGFRTVDYFLLCCLYPHDAREQGMLPEYILYQTIHPSVVRGVWTAVQHDLPFALSAKYCLCRMRGSRQEAGRHFISRF